jgi:hypothetical protein
MSFSSYDTKVMIMTLDQLERRVHELERQMADLQKESLTLSSADSASRTFGMFRDDPLFDEIVRLGREYRNQINAEADGC